MTENTTQSELVRPIVDEACNITGCSRDDFHNGRIKSRSAIVARRAVVEILHTDIGMSYPEIAAATCRLFHTSAITQHRAYKTSEYTMAVADRLRKRLAAIRSET